MLEAQIVDRNTYENASKSLVNVFNTAAFAETNRNKVDEIIYLLIVKGNSPRFGCVFGQKDDEWNCPFSAPFGYIEPLKKEQKIVNYKGAMDSLYKIAIRNGCKRLQMSLPPSFYDHGVINTWYSLMLNSGWKVKYVDVNYSLDVLRLKDNYFNNISYNAKRNLNIANRSNLSLLECTTDESKKEAYRIIKINREYRNHPLRMSEKHVLDTMKVISARAFIVSDDNNNSVAAAFVFDVTDTHALVVYWGDVPGVKDKKVINFLAYELLNIYCDRGFSYLDIGISTELGIPNYGLCDFKDSIGCERTAKFTLYKDLC